MNKIRLLWFSLSAAFLTWAVVGCSTTQTTAAAKVSAATDAGIRLAMTGWGSYVAAYHPGTNAELKVRNAFVTALDAELAAADATISLANNPSNTAPADAANNALLSARMDLLNLLASLTNNAH